MKRVLCLFLALVMLVSLGGQAFADGVLYCRICGKQIPTDSKVCPYCGEKVILLEDIPAQNPAPAETGPEAAAVADAAAAVAAALSDAVSAALLSTPTTTDTKGYPSSASSPVTSASAVGPFNSAGNAASAPGRVYITKNPTSESVPYGGSCMFIAHAANASSVTWYIANADRSLITTAAEATSVVSGLYVSGAYSDTLSLSGIPSWMNGCQVQACFSGEGGPVYSEPAWIWTYQPAQQASPCSGWNWWNWFCYYYCDDPYYWDCPGYWYSYWCEYPHCAPFWFDPCLPYDPAWPHYPCRPPYVHELPSNPEPSVKDVLTGSGQYGSQEYQYAQDAFDSAAVNEPFDLLIGADYGSGPVQTSALDSSWSQPSLEQPSVADLLSVK